LEAFARALASDARNPEVWNSQGAVLLRLHRDQEALDSFERASVLAPDNADAWYGQYRALSRLGREAEANAAIERAGRLRFAEVLHRNRR